MTLTPAVPDRRRPGRWTGPGALEARHSPCGGRTARWGPPRRRERVARAGRAAGSRPGPTATGSGEPWPRRRPRGRGSCAGVALRRAGWRAVTGSLECRRRSRAGRQPRCPASPRSGRERLPHAPPCPGALTSAVGLALGPGALLLLSFGLIQSRRRSGLRGGAWRTNRGQRAGPKEEGQNERSRQGAWL